jgi:hypothetical protein
MSNTKYTGVAPQKVGSKVFLHEVMICQDMAQTMLGDTLRAAPPVLASVVCSCTYIPAAAQPQHQQYR